MTGTRALPAKETFRRIAGFLAVTALAAGCAVATPHGAVPGPKQHHPSPTVSQTPSASSTQESSSTQSPDSTATPTNPASPTHSASPTPPTPAATAATPRSAARVPGANHNEQAVRYLSATGDVQTWLNHPGGAGYPTSRVAYLTFDDGPSHNTDEILDVLADEGVPASFFVLGPQVEARPDLVRREVAEGHSVCAHSYSHDYHELYPGRVADPIAIQRDHARVLTSLRGALGDDFFAHCYRYPGGHESWRGLTPADQALTAQDVHWLDWNALNRDAELPLPKTTEELVGNVLASWAARGQPNVLVVLMHDSQPKKLTASALPELIAALRAHGFAFQTLD